MTDSGCKVKSTFSIRQIFQELFSIFFHHRNPLVSFGTAKICQLFQSAKFFKNFLQQVFNFFFISASQALWMGLFSYCGCKGSANFWLCKYIGNFFRYFLKKITFWRLYVYNIETSEALRPSHRIFLSGVLPKNAKEKIWTETGKRENFHGARRQKRNSRRPCLQGPSRPLPAHARAE